MKYYNKRKNTYESISIDKITKGIQSIKNGNRTPDSVGADLDFFFTKLEELNKPMYEELFTQYCTARLEAEHKIKEIHS